MLVVGRKPNGSQGFSLVFVPVDVRHVSYFYWSPNEYTVLASEADGGVYGGAREFCAQQYEAQILQ